MLNVRRIGLSEARTVVASAERRANDLGVAVVVAVVDDGGNMLSLDRMDGAPLLSVEFAADKAWTAAAFGLATEEWWMMLQADAALAAGLPHRPRFVAIGGGAPLRSNGFLVGGVGVSGGSVDDDIACAEAGASELLRLDGSS